MIRRLSQVLLCLAAAASASALEWKTRHLSFEVAPLQKTTDAAFEFTNTSAQPVSITNVESSCDCLDVAPSAAIIAPGESGRINARFTVGDRFGIYRRTILVTTNEGTPPVALAVEFNVAEVASLTPRSVEWPVDGPAREQAVDIVVTPGIELTISHAQATSEEFSHRLETVEAGRHYRLHVTPKSTREIANAAFRLHAKAASGEDLILSAYASVH